MMTSWLMMLPDFQRINLQQVRVYVASWCGCCRLFILLTYISLFSIKICSAAKVGLWSWLRVVYYAFRDRWILGIQFYVKIHVTVIVDCKPDSLDSCGWHWEAIIAPIKKSDRFILDVCRDRLILSRNMTSIQINMAINTFCRLGDFILVSVYWAGWVFSESPAAKTCVFRNKFWCDMFPEPLVVPVDLVTLSTGDLLLLWRLF